jgi:hypothetical protein
VEEIPKLPPSVAQVETAIPAFIGYTEKAIKDGENIVGKPTRISSMVEFETYFGGAYEYQPGDILVKLDPANNFSVKEVDYNDVSFFLHDAMRLFFDNGGGDCWVIAVNLYASASFTNGKISSSADLTGGLTVLEKYDEPTIIVIPDAVNLKETEFYPLQQAMLTLCGKLMDRVAILDLKENEYTEWSDAVDKFRDKIGINNLKYGAAYTPWIINSYSQTIDFKLLNDGTSVVNLASVPLSLANLTSDSKINALVTTAANASDDVNTLNNAVDTLRGTFLTLTDKYNKLKSDILVANLAGTPAAFDLLMTYVESIAEAIPTWRVQGIPDKRFKNTDLTKVLDAIAVDPANGLRKYILDLIAFEKNDAVAVLTGGAHVYNTAYKDVPDVGVNSWLGVASPDATAKLAPAIGPTTTDADKRNTAILALANLDAIFKGLDAFYNQILNSAQTYKTITQNGLYAGHPIIGNIVKAVAKLFALVPPGSSVAGVYARVDNARGVWKAPANESLNSVTEPSVVITADEQSNLNVDSISGKSINAIRSFTGRGSAIVWGARTLAGNDNEWRYISVRRFFNMVEESCKNATAPFVFEPNDANTWVKVQAMIENFLTTLWRQGALQGIKPEHAFYVAVGLGKTMTALDILEGRMIIEIGMAAVRPAEFIILRFSHKMAES